MLVTAHYMHYNLCHMLKLYIQTGRLFVQKKKNKKTKTTRRVLSGRRRRSLKRV